MENRIVTLKEVESFVAQNEGAVLYYSSETCNVCKILKPKLIEFLGSKFPKMKFLYIDASLSKEAAAQRNILTIPTILFFFGGKEFLRKGRNFNFDELEPELARYYNMIFD